MTTPAYPGYGNPCNQCGVCCLAEQCNVSVEFFGSREVCPALKKTESKYVCDLQVNPLPYLSGVNPINVARWVPEIFLEHPEFLAAHFRFIFGNGFCDSDGDEDG